MDSLDKIKNKIFTNSRAAQRVLKSWRKNDEKLVFTNGCFDIIHRGHVEILSKASDLGDKLIIGLNSDESVKRLKGDNRPVQDGYSRALILASFDFVDLVIFFSEDTPYDLIKSLKPDILVKGGDYKIKEIVGNDIVTENGGKVMTIKFLDGFSTSKILDRIEKL